MGQNIQVLMNSSICHTLCLYIVLPTHASNLPACLTSNSLPKTAEPWAMIEIEIGLLYAFALCCACAPLGVRDQPLVRPLRLRKCFYSGCLGSAFGPAHECRREHVCRYRLRCVLFAFAALRVVSLFAHTGGGVPPHTF